VQRECQDRVSWLPRFAESLWAARGPGKRFLSPCQATLSGPDSDPRPDRGTLGPRHLEVAMSPADTVRGRAVVVQPGEGPSYWQPIPANGHADPALFPASTGFDRLAMGYQTIAVGRSGTRALARRPGRAADLLPRPRTRRGGRRQPFRSRREPPACSDTTSSTRSSTMGPRTS
jgi:hypothetical protein